uniref:DUF7086 domain-containing protein n=1 Tax=Ananas comosus var. bracteatus TaxID=296719 RepID=A0A6V7PBA8_ANACO|nr:unnamed protein product [Ananas comosus var. bracteatus]
MRSQNGSVKMTMERHGGGGGDGNGDEKRVGCDELDLELSLAPRELRERPAEDPLPPVHVSQELRELLPPQSEQYQQQQQQQESISPSRCLLPLEQRQPSLSSKKSVLFRKLQPLRSSRLRAGPAATSQPRRRGAAPPILSSAEPVLPNRQPPGFSPVMPRARNRSTTTRHVHRSVEQTEFFQSAKYVAPALPPAPPPITAVRPAFASLMESVDLNVQPTHPPVSSPAPPPIGAGRPPFPWAGDRPATIRPINWLRANGITHVHGEVRCGSCGVQKVVSYELESKVGDTRDFMYSLRHYLDDHAQPVWSTAKLLPCDSCGGSGCVGR